MKAISIINLGCLEGTFKEKDNRAQDGGGKKRDAVDITSNKGMSIEDKATLTNEGIIMLNVENGVDNDDTNNETEELQEVITKGMEEKSSDECLLQFIYDTEAKCPNTGEVTTLFQTIKSG